MELNFTQREAIQLILGFRMPPAGYWKDTPIDEPEVLRFIEAGCTSLDKESQEKYLLNDKGAEALHPYIKQISEDFIRFVGGKGFECYDTDGVKWFSEKYSLDNDTAEDLFDYITFNLETYGYKRFQFCRREIGKGYYFKQVTARI